MQNRESAILTYGGLSARTLIEMNIDELKRIQLEKERIERELGLTSDEIIVEASKLVSRE